MESRDYAALTVLLLLGLYLYTLPLKENPFPFGEGDAVHKFGLTDWMYQEDKAVSKSPFFYATWYPYLYKDDFFRLPNPAPYQIQIATARLLAGGDRFRGPNLFFSLTAAIFSSIAVYFVIRQLYGFWPGFLSGLLLLFPMQSVMAYLWGQRPHLISLAYFPLVAYCYHKYSISFLDKENKPIYLILAAVLTAGMVNHLQALTLLAAFLFIHTAYLLAKHKKLPFNWKHGLAAAAVAILLVAPFLRDVPIESEARKLTLNNINHLFHWFKAEANMPNSFLYKYSNVHGGWWTLPFLLIGILLLAYRRKEQDILLLSWLVALYVVLHLDVINFIEQGRAARLIYGTAYIFYPLAAIGFLSIPSLARLQGNKTRYLLAAAFIALTLVFNARAVYPVLKEAYPPFMRMTSEQYEAAIWIDNNLPEDSLLYGQGMLTYPKLRWVQMLSHRAMSGWNQNLEQTQEEVSSFPVTNKVTHLLFDYSDYEMLRGDSQVEQMRAVLSSMEKEYAANATLLYDRNNIRVYSIE